MSLLSPKTNGPEINSPSRTARANFIDFINDHAFFGISFHHDTPGPHFLDGNLKKLLLRGRERRLGWRDPPVWEIRALKGCDSIEKIGRILQIGVAQSHPTRDGQIC